MKTMAKGVEAMALFPMSVIFIDMVSPHRHELSSGDVSGPRMPNDREMYFVRASCARAYLWSSD